MQTERELFNTADSFDAGVIGLDGPAEHYEAGGLRLTMGRDHLGPYFTLNGPEGEIALQAPEAKIIAEMIGEQIRYAKAAA
jgi:hypothetical protein